MDWKLSPHTVKLFIVMIKDGGWKEPIYHRTTFQCLSSVKQVLLPTKFAIIRPHVIYTTKPLKLLRRSSKNFVSKFVWDKNKQCLSIWCHLENTADTLISLVCWQCAIFFIDLIKSSISLNISSVVCQLSILVWWVSRH